MRIYNYLFYISYVAAKKSKNFDDIPVLGGIIYPLGCLLMNIGALFFLIEGIGERIGLDIDFDVLVYFQMRYKWVISFGSVLLMMFYYLYKGKYKRIIKYYEDRKNKLIQIPAFIVISIYVVSSFGIILLAALFRNRHWIFSAF